MFSQRASSVSVWVSIDSKFIPMTHYASFALKRLRLSSLSHFTMETAQPLTSSQASSHPSRSHGSTWSVPPHSATEQSGAAPKPWLLDASSNPSRSHGSTWFVSAHSATEHNGADLLHPSHSCWMPPSHSSCSHSRNPYLLAEAAENKWSHHKEWLFPNQSRLQV